jgi:hypothetical protein
MQKPNLFLIGCGKSGTTSLYSQLKEHPEIFMSQVKGPNYFGLEPDEAFPEFFNNLKKYLSLFQDSNKYSVIGEASHYFHILDAPKKIKEFSKNSKIIIMLRNPYGVVKSYYNGGSIPRELDFLSDKAESHISSKELKSSLNYKKNILNWAKSFPVKDVHFIIFDDFIKSPEAEYKKVCKFLNVDSKFVPDLRPQGESRALKNKWLLRLLGAFSVKFKVAIKQAMPTRLEQSIRFAFLKLTTKEKLKLDPLYDLTKRLKPILNPRIDWLSKYLKMDLSTWKR